MKKINTIIVDDELEAREGIKLLLQEDPEINIIALCKNGVEAIDLIQDHGIDLVFLDIQMPVVSGFEVINSLPKDKLPYIIFITAYDQYAIKAFEIHAVDYILKPFTNSRFAEGLARAKQLIFHQKAQFEQERLVLLADQYAQKSSEPDQTILSSQGDEERLIVKEKGRVKFIPLKDIVRLEAYDYYVKVHTKNQFHLIRESMKKLESRVPAQFIRIHKSSIINKNFVKVIKSTTSSELIIRLIDDIELKVGRSFKEILKKLLIK